MSELPEFQDRKKKTSFFFSDEALFALQAFSIGLGVATIAFAFAVEPLIK